MDDIDKMLKGPDPSDNVCQAFCFLLIIEADEGQLLEDPSKPSRGSSLTPGQIIYQVNLRFEELVKKEKGSCIEKVTITKDGYCSLSWLAEWRVL